MLANFVASRKSASTTHPPRARESHRWEAFPSGLREGPARSFLLACKVIVVLHFLYLLILWRARDALLIHRGSVYLTLIITYFRLKSVTANVTKRAIMEINF